MKTATQTQLKIRAWICQNCHPDFVLGAIEDVEKYHPEITEPKQVNALFTWEAYWEVYKDCYGISPRWTKYSDFPAEHWQYQIDTMQKEMFG